MAVDPHGGLPIKMGPCSNGEYLPQRPTPVVEETIRRTNEEAGVLANRLGTSRRQFLASTCGSALALLTLAACSKEERASRGLEPSGGTFKITPEATTEPEAAASVLSGDEFIMDVQGHLLDYAATPNTDWSGSPFIGQYFPQAACGETDPRACFSIEAFLDLFFLQSDTSLVVLSAVPIWTDPNPLSADVMAQTRAIAAALCEQDRVIAQGQAGPNIGEPEVAFAAMSALRDDFEIGAWKVYTHLPGDRAFFLDDHDPEGLQIGQRFIDHVREIGPPIISVHRGLKAVGGGRSAAFTDPVDIGPAAAANPDISFVVYHSGYEIGVHEGPFDPDNPNGGIDRLVASLASSAVGHDQNVYAELGSTWRSVMTDPDQAAHVLGKLLVAVGPDRVLWGTDSIWYGSPQDQIEAFRSFEITENFQERFGYPALTPEIKEKILGLNSAALYGVGPAVQECEFTREDVAASRIELASAPITLGPSTIEEALGLMSAHGA